MMNGCETRPGGAEQEGLYVYCIALGRASRSLGPMGLDGETVYAVPGDGLSCVVHHCRAEPYQSDDPQAVQAWVMAHDRVVRTAQEAFGTVLPMTFNMIVAGGEDATATSHLKAWMAEHGEAFRHRLRRLAGKVEYNVQISWDRRRAADEAVRENPELQRMQAEAARKPKGTAYMLHQRVARAAREAVETQAGRHAKDFYSRIRPWVHDLRVENPHKARGDEQVLLNLSCLAPRNSASLGDALDEIRDTEGVSVRFTGPWPPYSFAAAG